METKKTLLKEVMKLSKKRKVNKNMKPLTRRELLALEMYFEGGVITDRQFLFMVSPESVKSSVTTAARCKVTSLIKRGLNTKALKVTFKKLDPCDKS